MPEEITEAPEAPTAPEEVVETTPEVTAQAEAGDVGSLSLEDLNDVSAEDAEKFLYHGKALEIPDKPKAETEAAPEVETTPVAEVTEPAEAEPVAEEVEGEDDKPLPGRISTKQFDSEDQRILSTMHAINRGLKPGDANRVGIPEVVAMLAKQDGKAPTTPTTTAEPDPSPVEAISAEVTELETALNDLRTQKYAAIEEGNSTVDIEKEIDKAQDAIRDAKIEQRDAQRQQAEKAATRAQTAQQLRKSSQDSAIAEFPDLAKGDSPLGIAASQVIADLKNPDHPDNALLKAAKAPRHVLNEAIALLAEKEGVSEQAIRAKYAAKAATPAPKAAPVTSKPATPVARKVLPAVGSQATNPPKAAPTAQDVYDAVKDDGDGDSAWEAIYGNKPLNLLRP